MEGFLGHWKTFRWDISHSMPFLFFSLEKGKATHCSILAWRIPLTTIHGIAKSQTRLNDFHFLTPFLGLERKKGVFIWGKRVYCKSVSWGCLFITSATFRGPWCTYSACHCAGVWAHSSKEDTQDDSCWGKDKKQTKDSKILASNLSFVT